MRAITWLAVAILFHSMFGCLGSHGRDESKSASESVLTLQMFFKEMQLLSRRHQVGKTDLDKEDSLELLRWSLKDEFDGKTLEFEIGISRVTWNKDMARIVLNLPMHSVKTSAAMPFDISNLRHFDVPMTREEATGLNTKKPLVFRGKMKFVPNAYAVFNSPPESHVLFRIRHRGYVGIISVGAIVTEDYSIFIDDKVIIAVESNAAVE